jgi:hypothetical protein
VVGTTNKNAVTVDTTIKNVYRGWHNQQNCALWLAQPLKLYRGWHNQDMTVDATNKNTTC